MGKELKKRKTESEDDPVLIDDATMELILQEENSKRATLIKTKEIPVSRNKVIVANEKDKRQFEEIDEIIKSIQESFLRTKNVDLDKEYILEVLKMHSFNIVSSYLYLCSPEDRRDFCFTDVDDYIIKNMKNSEYYKDMIAKKGKQTVNEREKFLMIEYFDN